MEVKTCLAVPCCVIITGASGGYGSELAKCFLPHLQPKSILILTSRASQRLNEVEKAILLLSINEIKVKVLPCDLSDANNIDIFFNELKNLNGLFEAESVLLIHNAGSLGDVTLTIDKYDCDMIKKHFELNVSHVLYFTKLFLDFFKAFRFVKHIVNISSLCAIKPFPTMGLYCTAKAARDMMFKVLAIERNDVKILNWAPGPMPTKMLTELSNSSSESVSKQMKYLLSSKSYVECQVSCEKLIQVLKSSKFDSGQHIDFYNA